MEQQASNEIATLPPAQRAAVALNVDVYKEQIAAKVKESADIVQVIDPAGREQAHRIGMVLLKLRTGIKARGEEVRKDATVFNKAVIAAEKELVELISPEETRIIGLRDAYDEQVRAAKEEADRKESERVDRHRNNLAMLRAEVLASVGKSAAHISERMAALRVVVDVAEYWEEFLPRAIEVRKEVVDQLQVQYDAQHAIEENAAKARQEAQAEAERVARQAEENRVAALEIERQRQELAAAQAETARVAAEQEAERQRAAAAELAEQQRVAAETKRQLDEQQARLAADREAQAQREREFNEKIAAQAREDERRKAALAEEQRVAALPIERVAEILDGPAEVIPPSVVDEVVAGIRLPDVAVLQQQVRGEDDAAQTSKREDEEAESLFRHAVRLLMQTRNRNCGAIRDMLEDEMSHYDEMMAEE